MNQRTSPHMAFLLHSTRRICITNWQYRRAKTIERGGKGGGEGEDADLEQERDALDPISSIRLA